MLVFLTGASPLSPQDLEDYESRLIVSLVKNIDWQNDGAAINVGILGNSKVLPKLTKLVSEQKLPMQVRKIGFIDEVDKCNLVFVSKSQSANLAAVIQKIDDKQVLVITEDPSQAEDTEVSFFVENNKLRFTINRGKAEKKGFKISSTLMKYAKLI